MARNISFMLTEQQMRDRTKTVTRRMMDELPLYKCHKEVRAGLITDIFKAPEGNGELLLDFGKQKTTWVKVSASYMQRHTPKRGGYYIRYRDGYESWSPAEAFEGGYTRVEG